MTESSLYFIFILDGIRNMFKIIAIFSVLFPTLFMFYQLLLSCDYEYKLNEHISPMKKCVIFSTIVLIFSSAAFNAIPSTKAMAAIKIIPMIANSQAAKDFNKDLVPVLVKLLETKKEEVK